MTSNLAASLYLISGILFILALRGLSSPETSRQGNFFGILGMTIAIIVTFLFVNISFSSLLFIICSLAIGGSVGTIIAYRISMTAMPQLVAGFHSLVGLAAVLVALSAFYNPEAFGLGTLNNIKTASLVEMSIGASIGAITFTGSVIAFLKLQGLMSGSPITFKGQHLINLLIGIGIVSLIIYITINQSSYIFGILIVGSFLIGIFLIIPIGGADMPVVIALLNSFSGLAACAAGFVITNNVLIVAGALVGASGLILTNIMCKAMNRSLSNVLFSGFGAVSDISADSEEDQGEVSPINAQDAYLILEAATSVLIVPGYGMAVAQAQHAVRELGELLEANGAEVKYAIHPVAGRMPGHMNVLLAEANVSYDVLVEPEDVNPIMDTVDVCMVIGANDVVNPDAKDNEGSPIYGMPIIEVDNSKTVFVLKRSMASGFAGIQNPLFFKSNSRMLFGDAKETVSTLVSEFKG